MGSLFEEGCEEVVKVGRWLSTCPHAKNVRDGVCDVILATLHAFFFRDIILLCYFAVD